MISTITHPEITFFRLRGNSERLKKCLMPGATSKIKPLSAGESTSSSSSDQVSQLELRLQRQLEEDIARIFDESIYSDLEVVCGKLKILTHSCILKARTHKFYHKLETILHVNIGRNTFDEIYSFISDAYTECNIQHQEKEIIKYLNDNLNLVKNIAVINISKNKNEEKEEVEVYSTPNGSSPEDKSFQKALSSSPSTELTKEYYALVPIDDNILDKELNEQDALSNALQSISKSQIDIINGKQNKQCIKPTSLFLNSSHTPKINKHSSSCDIFRDSDVKIADCAKINNNVSSQIIRKIKKTDIDKTVEVLSKNLNLQETSIDKVFEASYSPDSLITDEPSSSSDYLSAAYVVSPGAVSYAGGPTQLNVGDNGTKMENIITISDSGLENTGMLESLNSHKDVTLTDVSLTESTFHDMINDETNGYDAACNTLQNPHNIQKLTRSTSVNSVPSGTSIGRDLNERKSDKSLTDMSGTSTKEEKQRQNEEIVILESSSLSSETGSWESVFPPKLPEKDICEKFIASERQSALEEGIRYKPNDVTIIQSDTHDELCPSLVQKSPFKSTSCFIDAASLADEGDDVITVHAEFNENKPSSSKTTLPESSCPVPLTSKKDLSPNDWSESNDNDDSLEQTENKDLDSNPRDLSPTIFEMTPITEDSLCANTFDTLPVGDQQDPKTAYNPTTDTNNQGNALQNIAFSTPNNSIISVRCISNSFKSFASEESESDTTVVRRDNNPNNCTIKSAVPTREAFVSHTRRNEDESSIVCRAAPGTSSREIGSKTEKVPQAASNASFWVVDMSSSPKSDVSECTFKTDDTLLRSAPKSISSVENCKSRSSVDSDSSEKSHKFYIDLSTLSDTAPEQTQEGDETNEKKNIFSMFIDLGNKPTAVKGMPARLSSSLSTKKNTKSEIKCTVSKVSKTTKTSTITTSVASVVDTTLDGSMFEKLESLCNDPNISITEIIKAPSEIMKNIGSHSGDVPEVSVSSARSNNIIKQATKEETAVNDDLFVKLSDLDKPIPNVEPVFLPVKKEYHGRMTRSIPDNNWRESSQTINASSFHSENALSLNRLFPHLKNDFSRSMPGSLSSRTRSPLRLGFNWSPGDIDEQASDMSEMSSVQSSYCRSVVENSTTEETSQSSSLISNCQSRLGQDLLRMFLEELATDVIVEAQGRRIRAHKCILSSRCPYFAAILSGGWVESAGNVIALPPFSFNVVHFALCHIYSGVSKIPDSISIVELATIADMLGLEGLKEVIMFTLKAKYCHHFHKPCDVCIAGVLECFPLTSAYGLDDLYRKCLRWITRHFYKVWPTKAFATLPSELLNKCLRELFIHLTTDNIVEVVYGCGMTVASLTASRWSLTVERMCRRVADGAAHFAAGRLGAVLHAMGALPAGAPSPAMQALDDCMAAAIEWAMPEEVCRAYAALSQLVRDMRAHHSAKPDLISGESDPPSLLHANAPTWRLRCESVLVCNAPRVVDTTAFNELPADLRKRLRELGCIIYGARTVSAAARALPHPHRKVRTTPKHSPRTARTLDIERVRASFVPYATKPQPQLSIGSPPKRDVLAPNLNKSPFMIPKVRTTKAQEERAKYNSSKTHESQERLNCKNVVSRAAYEHTKPRYLEPRPLKEEKVVVKKPQPKMVSSSESSRNSSPIQARAARGGADGRRAGGVGARLSQDSLASRPRTADPSTDSLSESQNSNKYATYTKAKHTTEGSVESVAIPSQVKCHSIPPKAKTTRIPVYQSSSGKTWNVVSATREVQRKLRSEKTLASSMSPGAPPRNKANERKPSGSLMNATKSSQAKMVPKIVKETQNSKYASKPAKCKLTASRSPPPPPANEIPIMERSGTFLKDEPMFGDKTVNIDE